MSFYGNIDPDNLIGLVRNSAPYIFTPENQKEGSISEIFEKYPEKGWLYILNSYLLQDREGESQTKAVKWYEYFLLCLCKLFNQVIYFLICVQLKYHFQIFLHQKKTYILDLYLLKNS